MSDVTAEMLRRLLLDAGLGPGMRILDVGCGHGKVSALAAELVGDEGSVVAFDREADRVDFAREHRRHDNIDFVAATIDSFEWNEPFDAAIGRRVLMYQADPVAAVKRLASHVRPGGVIAFQEIDVSMPPLSSAPLPLHVQVRDWIWGALPKETPRDFGFDLYRVFTQAGLQPDVRAEALVHTPTTDHPLADVVRWMLPKIVASGVDAEDVDIDTLDARLTAERAEADATYIDQLVFGVWARLAA
ncbi:MAG: class I SAM-dependent methyltransferase [Deltaproteobacteria bacterium]|jgi:SAM-dependent methyltransferase